MYYTAAGKHVEIAEHMRYLPMGYFNQNSLGQITSVTTNTMEQLADVATGVVMLTTQGMLTTLVITAMVLFFDWRIGLVAVVGILLFFGLNSVLQKRSQKLAPIKIASDTDVVEKVLEYVQGISEVRGYNLTGRTSKGMIICSFLVLDSLGTAGNYSSLLRAVDMGVDKAQTILDLQEMDIEGKDNIMPLDCKILGCG